MIDASEIFIYSKTVDDFNILDKNDIHIRLMYQLPNNFINYYGTQNEINDLKTRLARLEAMIDSSFNSRWNHKQWNRCLKRKAYIIRNDTNKIRRKY